MIETNRKSVLLITRNFPPMIGGMEKLNQRMFEGLAMRFNAVLIAPKGSRQFAPQHATVYESPSLNLPIFFLYAFFISIYLAIKLKPSSVLAGSGITAPFAFMASRFAKGKAVVYVHGLDLIAESSVYQRIWLPFIRCCDAVIANSSNTKRLAVENGVQEKRLSVVFPGTDIPELNPENAKRFREKFELDQCPILLSVGRITERKGLLPFIKNAFPLIRVKFPTVRLVVIGSEPLHALRKDNQDTRAEINDYLKESDLTDTVVFLGRCNDEALIAAYQAANVHVFPVLASSSDVEGFGMVAIEAAANGLQTVAFDVGGVSDAVKQEVTGILVDQGDYSSLAYALLKCIEKSNLQPDKDACIEASKTYGWDRFEDEVIKIIMCD